MNIQKQVTNYINSQPEPKRTDMQALHNHIQGIMPESKLWFLDGKDSDGKIVSNPNIGYGHYTIIYADARPDGKSGRETTKEFYQIGLSANATGISVYIMGIPDKTYLAETFGSKLGKAKVAGYCIKFKTLKDINIDVLEEAVRYGVLLPRASSQ